MKLRLCVGLLALALTVSAVIVGSRAYAQSGSRAPEIGVLTPQAGAAPVAAARLSTHALRSTGFDTSSPGASASCNSAGCSAYATIYSELVTCPGPIGTSCTYQITIQSQTNAGSNDFTVGEEGVYQFLVDDAAPTPGPVGSGCACFTWSGSSHQFSFPIRATSYATTATVTNATAGQAHSIVVNVGCNEVWDDTSGCFANSGFANLSVATYVP